MQQLTGVDEFFVGLESPTTNSVVGVLIRFDAPNQGQPLPDETFMRQRIAERIDYLPPLRQVIVKTPLHLDYDYLGEAGRVDIAAHLSTVRLPDPGADRELAAEVARIMGTGLAPKRPRWDYTVIEGLDSGGVAHLLRIDHAAVDGAMFTYVFNALSDDPPPFREADRPGVFPDPVGGSAEMLARGLWGTAARPARVAALAIGAAKWMVERFPKDGVTTLPALVAKVVPGDLGRPLVALVNKRQRRAGQPEIASMIPTFFPPKTPFNRQVSAQRSYLFTELPLAESKAAGKAFGTTLNNVVVAVCAGAIRRMLIEREVSVDTPLIVCCPVSLRTGAEENPWANHINMMYAPLPIQLTDPVARLEAVTAELTKAKSSFDNLPTHLIRDVSSLVPSAVMGLATNTLVRMPGDLSRTWFNVTISNIRGPDHVNTMNGLTVAGYHPASFLTVGGNLNLSLWSYRGKLCLGIIGAREQVGDLQPVARYLEEELAALVEAGSARHPSGASRASGATSQDAADAVEPGAQAPEQRAV
ncbi:MAG TPA: wax ester/triacylglycerol synthase family O-acyltransferase [Dermatophilaceae bacterium]|nr:wax ester/triacylglycerol synthase family O-acyltransferase [Dermatophilaceae bacterium]